MYIYASKVSLSVLLQLRMQCSGTRIKFSQVVYFVRFSYIAVKNVFFCIIVGCLKFEKKLEIFFNAFVVAIRK